MTTGDENPDDGDAIELVMRMAAVSSIADPEKQFGWIVDVQPGLAARALRLAIEERVDGLERIAGAERIIDDQHQAARLRGILVVERETAKTMAQDPYVSGRIGGTSYALQVIDYLWPALPDTFNSLDDPSSELPPPEILVPYFEVASALGRALDHDSPEHWAVVQELEEALADRKLGWHNAMTDSAGSGPARGGFDHGELQVAIAAVLAGVDPEWQPVLAETYDQAASVLDFLCARGLIPPPDGYTRDEVAEDVPAQLREPKFVDAAIRTDGGGGPGTSIEPVDDDDEGGTLMGAAMVRSWKDGVPPAQPTPEPDVEEPPVHRHEPPARDVRAEARRSLRRRALRPYLIRANTVSSVAGEFDLFVEGILDTIEEVDASGMPPPMQRPESRVSNLESRTIPVTVFCEHGTPISQRCEACILEGPRR